MTAKPFVVADYSNVNHSFGSLESAMTYARALASASLKGVWSIKDCANPGRRYQVFKDGWVLTLQDGLVVETAVEDHDE